MIVELETDRLYLRQWREKDLPLFAKLNADPEVMKYFPSPLSLAETHSFAEKCRALISAKGWGFWALELKGSGEFIGFTGLNAPKPSLPCSPCVEVGWRLRRDAWGNGYATEAATESLKFAFEDLSLDDVVSFTTVANARSRAVMARLGFTNTDQNFRHPDIPQDHSLAEHVLYKITRSQWQAA